MNRIFIKKESKNNNYNKLKFVGLFLFFFFSLFSFSNKAFAYSYNTLDPINSSWGSAGNVQFSPAGLNSGDINLMLFNATTTYSTSEVEFEMSIGGINNTDEHLNGTVQLLIYSGDGTTATHGTLLYTSDTYDLSTMGTYAGRGMSGGTPWDTGGTLLDTLPPKFIFTGGITLTSGSHYIFVLHKVTTLTWASGGGYGTGGYCDTHDCVNNAGFILYAITNGSVVPKTSENSAIPTGTTVSTTGTLATRFGGSGGGGGSPYTADSSISWFTSPDWNTESSNATTTTNPTFTFNYAINSNEFNNYTYGFSYGQACLNIARNGISSSTPINNIGTYTKICQPITSAGTGTFSTTTSLTNNTLYSYFGSIEATSTEVFPSNKTTLTNSLQIGTVTGSGIVPAGWVQQFDANSTSTSATPFGNFLNVPELLKTKVPFGYIYQIGTIMFNAGSSTSATIPSGTFDVDFASGTPAYKKLQIDMFSTTTITHFLNPTLVGTLRSLLVAIEWVAFALYLWKRGHSIIT